MLKTKDTVLEIDNIVKEFPVGKNGKMTACNKVSLCFEKGKTLGIIGESGCGKSTLLSILAGFECYESGNIPEEESRGVVFQSPALFPWLTVKGNVEYGLKRKGIPKGERKEQVETFLKMVQLEDYAKYYPRELSGGMQQRAALARTLVLRPEMLLMDEPFSALDPKLRIQMQQLTLELWKELKQTIFIVTHDVEEAVMVADIIYLMGESPQGVRRKVEVSWVKKEENRNTKEFFELKNSLLNT